MSAQFCVENVICQGHSNENVKIVISSYTAAVWIHLRQPNTEKEPQSILHKSLVEMSRYRHERDQCSNDDIASDCILIE